MKHTGSLLFVALSCAAAAQPQRSATHKGLNLPATQGTTRDGAFFPGLLQYEYNPDQVGRAARRAGFASLRLAVNVESANNVEFLKKHKAYIDAVGGRGIICMFDTSLSPAGSWPRTGNLTGKVDKVAQAWKKVHAVFEPYGEDVMYEIFNEPWGYQANAAAYVADMTNVVHLAGLPEKRVILAGLYGSADVQAVARAGWKGCMAYHVYVFWLPEGQRTMEHFSKRIQQDIAGLSDRIFITEFGVGLDGLKADVDEDELKQDVVKYNDQVDFTSDWHKEHPKNVDIQGVCAKHPGNAWCKKHLRLLKSARKESPVLRELYSLAQEPAAPNLGADVSAQVRAAVNVGADVAAKTEAAAKNIGADVTAKIGAATNIGADVAAQIAGEDPGAAAAQSPTYQEDTMGFLRGMRDALQTLKRQGVGVRGLHHWHGWHNGDTWDFWDAANARSSRIIQMMMIDQGEGVAPAGAEHDEYMSEDFVKDEQSVHMMLARGLGKAPAAECPATCGATTCAPGNEAQIGGKHLTGQFCNHMCSKVYGKMRFCGAGAGYVEEDAIDCGGCAHPPMCSGLPCWSASVESQANVSQASFLQKRRHK